MSLISCRNSADDTIMRSPVDDMVGEHPTRTRLLLETSRRSELISHNHFVPKVVDIVSQLDVANA